MISLLLFVIGCYVIAACSVHLTYRICQHQQMEKHYVLLSEQPEEQMEWILRSMYSFSQWMGTSIKVTIIPSAPCGDLVYMVDHWSRQWFPIHIQHQTQVPPHAIIIDLNKEQDLCKLPF